MKLAQPMYTTNTATYNVAGSYTGCMGYSFTPLVTKTIYALGFVDSNLDGLMHSHQVVVFVQTSASTGYPVVNVTVPAGTVGYLIDGSRYWPLPTPYTLTANQAYTVCGSYMETSDAYMGWYTSYTNYGAGFGGGSYPSMSQYNYALDITSFPYQQSVSYWYIGGQVMTACEICTTLQYHNGDSCIGYCVDCMPCNPGETMTVCTGPGAGGRTCVDPTSTTLVRLGSPTLENGYAGSCFAGMRGIEFTTTATSIVGLGVYDGPNAVTGFVGDGLMRTHQVGIWDTTPTLLGQVTVPALGGSLAGAFRFVALGSTLSLPAGTYYVAALWTAADCGSTGDTSAWEARTAATFSSPFTGVQGRYLATTTFSAPTSTDSTNVYYGASVITTCRTCGPTQYMPGGACLGNCTACSCSSGNYMTTQCPAGSTTNSPTCAACSCPANQYQSTPCTGKTVTPNPGACSACTVCSSNQYISSCTGPGTGGRTCTACTCPSGQYISSGTCTGAGSSNSPTCYACNACSSGTYKASPCTGAGFSASQSCTLCNCGAGKYITSPCTGNSATSPGGDAGCASCTTTTCPVNQYIGGGCDGYGTASAVTCYACTACTSGYYRASPCTGSTTTPSQGCTVCTCPSGQYIATACTGSGTTGPSGDAVCNPCTTTTCPSGQYIVTPCNGAGTSPTVTCSACTACPTGYYRTAPCTGSTTTPNQGCVACSCPSGQYMSVQCSGNSVSGPQGDATCTPCTTTSCPSGQYIVTPCNGAGTASAPTCAACTACTTGYYMGSPCTGTTTSANQGCVQCSCGAGNYITTQCSGNSVGSDATCSACTTTSCSSGQYISASCNGYGTSATVTCAACAVPASYYVGTPCTGTSTANNGVYYACSTCPSGQTMTSCTGPGTSGRTCATTYTCAACSTGQYIGYCSGPLTTDRTCYSCYCSSGYYMSTPCSGTSTTNNPTCTPCSCSSGSYIGGCTGYGTSNTASCTTATSSYTTWTSSYTTWTSSYTSSYAASAGALSYAAMAGGSSSSFTAATYTPIITVIVLTLGTLAIFAYLEIRFRRLKAARAAAAPKEDVAMAPVGEQFL